MEAKLINMQTSKLAGKISQVAFSFILVSAFILIASPGIARADFDSQRSCAPNYDLTGTGASAACVNRTSPTDRHKPIDFSEPQYIALQNEKCKSGGVLAVTNYLGEYGNAQCVDLNNNRVLVPQALVFGRYEQIPVGQTRIKPPETCGLSNFEFNKCIWNPLVVAVSSVLISVSAWILALSGVLFNWLVDNTIILYKTSVFAPVEKGISISWTIFRDLGNIVIIGMFIFMAIMTILGSQDYGYKKLLARILIIAVLINFSLLFTKIIIDISNFTGTQFYALSKRTDVSKVIDEANNRASGGTSIDVSSGVSLTNSGYAKEGIAGEFVKYLGVTSLADTREVLLAAASAQGAWVTLGHGLLATVFLLLAAFVLLYGSFLLLMRALLLLFLMITSAIAFATHLHPKLSEGKYGPAWDAWWRALLGSALLAPILMIFLYISLTISRQLNLYMGGKGSLGQLVTTQFANAPVLQGVFNYVIVLGLLFFSFKISGAIAKGAGGYDFAFSAVNKAKGKAYDLGKDLFKKKSPEKTLPQPRQTPLAISSTGAPATVAQRMNQAISQRLPQFGRAQARTAPVAAANAAATPAVLRTMRGPQAGRAPATPQQIAVARAAPAPGAAPAPQAQAPIPRPAPPGPQQTIAPPPVQPQPVVAAPGATAAEIEQALQAAQRAGEQVTRASRGITTAAGEARDALRAFASAARSHAEKVKTHAETVSQATAGISGGGSTVDTTQHDLLKSLRSEVQTTNDLLKGLNQYRKVA